MQINPLPVIYAANHLGENIMLLITEESIQEKNRMDVKFVKRLSATVVP